MNKGALNSISYGVYAIGVKAHDGRPSASIINALIQVTVDPEYVCVCVNHKNYTNECIKNNSMFSISVFNEAATFMQVSSLGFKSGRNNDKLASQKYHVDEDGLPILDENICTWFKCKVASAIETPTHTIFIAEVTDTSDKSVGKPMTYEYYHTVLKGKVPPNAPHSNSEGGETKIKGYVCDICGYKYDGAIPFEQLDDDYVCPVCGVGKDMFVESYQS